jgi:hypothetical protein
MSMLHQHCAGAMHAAYWIAAAAVHLLRIAVREIHQHG